MESKRRPLRPIVSHARHGDARRLPVNLDENRIRKELVEFHKGQSRISCWEFPLADRGGRIDFSLGSTGRAPLWRRLSYTAP
jgi:hypothetical protein